MSSPDVVLERLTRVTPLGLRLWDAAAHAVVTDGLAVEVFVRGDPQRRVAAHPNRVGTFVVARLPGPRDLAFEFGSGDPAFWAAVTPRPYVIEVRDARGYYQPFIVEQTAPVQGPAVPPCLPLASPPVNVVTLFPTASRPVPAGMAVVRAELRTPVGGRDGRPALGPASWALVQVHVGTLEPVRGLADREGRVAVIVPYPEPAAAPARPASPPYTAGPSLGDQEWPVRIDVFYAPVDPAPRVPDLCAVLAQPPAMAWTDAAATEPLGDQVLRYGHELVIRSVVVTPAASPP